MKIPKKVDPCPIAEAIMEIRFESDFPGDAIFGIIYDKFQDEYSEFDKLPILQIPDTIRSQDPSLMFKPHHKLKENNFILAVGPKMFSVANIREYSGWDLFSKKIYETCEKMSQLKIIEKVTRIGLRYINFFKDLDIYEKSTLKITLGGQSLVANQTNLTALIPGDNCINYLKMINDAEIGIENEIYKGSLIDIDTVLVDFPDTLLTNFRDPIEQIHIEEKKLFFSLLTTDFLQSLNPIY